MFSISSLFPFIQLMAGINFVPTFLKRMLERYFNFLQTIYKTHSDYILYGIDKKIEIIKISNGTIDINEIDKENLFDEVMKKKLELQKLAFQKELINDKIIGFSESLYNELDKHIKIEGEHKIPHSFIMSSIFCIFFLAFIPIFDIFLVNVNPLLILKLYLIWSIILHIVFQLILNITKNDFSKIVILYIVSSFILSILLIISLNGLIPVFIFLNFEFISLKILIPLLILSSFFTFVFYFMKYFYLSFKNSNKVNKKANDDFKKLDIQTVANKV